MSTIIIENDLLADATSDKGVGKANVSLNDSTSDESPALAINFNSYLDNIYIPLTNSLFPYNNISTAFDNALFEYLSEDIKDFQQKLSSFGKGMSDTSPDFSDKSFDDLSNMPVDESAEEGTTVSQQAPSSEVNSMSRDISSGNTFETSSSNIDLLVQNHTNLTVETSISQSNIFSFSPIVPHSENFLINSSNGGTSVPSSQAIQQDPLAVISITFLVGNQHTLLNGAGLTLLGIGPNANGGFSLNVPFILKTGFLNADSNFISSGEITAIDRNGDFTFIPTGGTPVAGSFTFETIDANGHTAFGTASISEVKDETYYSSIGVNDTSLVVSGSLLSGDAPAKGTTLSILDVQSTSLDQFGNTGLYIPVQGSKTISNVELLDDSGNVIDGLTTSITVKSNGDFTLTSSLNGNVSFPTDFKFSFVVGDNSGNSVLATATIIPEIKPIVLDLSGEGINLVAPSHSPITLGDITGDGSSQSIGWIGAGNGVLMFDPSGTGKLTSLDQISFVSYLPGAQTDLQGLAYFDTNHDGKLDSGDKDFQEFGVLFANGKFETLSQLGIAAISLNSNNQMETINGNTVFGLTSYQTVNGQIKSAADVGFGVGQTPPLQMNDVIGNNNQLNLSSIPAPSSSLSHHHVHSINGPSPVYSHAAGAMIAQEVTHISEHLNHATHHSEHV